MNRRFAVGMLSLAVAACGAPNHAGPACPPVGAAATSTVPPPASPSTSLEGQWRGSLGGQLRLVLTLTRDATGYHAVLESPDQNATIPVDRVTVDDNASSIRAEVGKVGGVYEATIARAPATMTGTWTQKGTTQPLVLTRGAAEAPAGTAAAKPRAPLDAPIDVAIPVTPAPFRAAGTSHLAYELHLTNFSGREILLRKIETSNAETKTILSTLEGEELAKRLARPGAIGPGLRAIVYAWLDLPADPPRSIEHRITVGWSDSTDERTVTLAKTTVSAEAPLVVGPPLRGGDWVAGNGPSLSSNHRRSLVPIAGRVRIAQRFAIDWVKAKDDKTFAGDPSANASYLAYGAEALAVADAVVTETKDGIAENSPGKTSDTVTLETIAGNHVVLDLGKGRFALYAHFQPKSLRVKVGDRVRRGQVLGLVGNSGNSTEPHLHFHVSDGPSPLGSEGVPYAFDAFEARGGKERDFRKVAREIPLEDDAVRFPAK